MRFGATSFDNVDLFGFTDDEELISPDPGARTQTSTFLKRYSAKDLFDAFEQYGF